MSIQIMNNVFYLRLDPMRKLVMLALADNASDGGRCWPSQQSIAIKASISQRSCRLHLHALAIDGWLSILSLGNGRGLTTQYLLDVNKIEAEAQERRAALKAEKAVKAEDEAVKAEEQEQKAELGDAKGGSAFPPEPSGNHHEGIIRESSVQTVDEAFRAKMREKYTGILTEIDERIDQALAHSQASKYKNKQLYVRGWLRRDAEFVSNRNGGTNGKSRANAQGDQRPREVYIIPEDADGKPIPGRRPSTMLPMQ